MSRAMVLPRSPVTTAARGSRKSASGRALSRARNAATQSAVSETSVMGVSVTLLNESGRLANFLRTRGAGLHYPGIHLPFKHVQGNCAMAKHHIVELANIEPASKLLLSVPS
jgi:hypothetical protein